MDGQVEEKVGRFVCLLVVSCCGRQSRWFSFEDSKRVVEEEKEEEQTPWWEVESNKCFTCLTVTKEMSVFRKHLINHLRTDLGI